MLRTLFPVEERALIIHGCVLAIQIHKISAFSPNQQLLRSTELSDSGSGIFEHFLKTNKYNNVGWLLVMSLDKVVREEGELRDSISQLRDHRDDLKTSLWVLGGFVSLEVSGLAITENQMRTVTLWMAELRKSWTPSHSRHPLIKWGHCLGKTDPTNRDGNLQEDQNEAQDTEPLNSGKSSLPVEEVSQPPFHDTCFSISIWRD